MRRSGVRLPSAPPGGAKRDLGSVLAPWWRRGVNSESGRSVQADPGSLNLHESSPARANAKLQAERESHRSLTWMESMPRPHKSEAVFAELTEGRRFSQRPGKGVTSDFVGHIRRYGSPHTWRWLTTTKPSVGSIPVPLTRFSIPTKFRKGPESRAPCSICSPWFPKFDDGYLVWFRDDGLLRIIGHECGHEFFEGDTWADALTELQEEAGDATARAYLAEHLPKLDAMAVEGWFLRLGLRRFLRLRDELAGIITKSAIRAIARSRTGAVLTVDAAWDRTDDRGRFLVGKRDVARVEGLDALLSKYAISDLESALMSSDELRDKALRAQDLRRTARLDLRQSHTALSSLVVAIDRARVLQEEFERLFLVNNLQQLSLWGRHRDCPTPFWIERIGDAEIYVGKGVKPLSFAGCRRLRLRPEGDATLGSAEID